jgi:hypothetical protein
MFAGLRRVVTVKRHGRAVHLKSAAKSENKTSPLYTNKGTSQLMC